MATMFLEKPHWGSSGVPFINKVTALLWTMSSKNSGVPGNGLFPSVEENRVRKVDFLPETAVFWERKRRELLRKVRLVAGLAAKFFAKSLWNIFDVKYFDFF